MLKTTKYWWKKPKKTDRHRQTHNAQGQQNLKCGVSHSTKECQFY